MNESVIILAYCEIRYEVIVVSILDILKVLGRQLVFDSENYWFLNLWVLSHATFPLKIVERKHKQLDEYFILYIIIYIESYKQSHKLSS